MTPVWIVSGLFCTALFAVLDQFNRACVRKPLHFSPYLKA